jgi:type I restriction enzyme S subunit
MSRNPHLRKASVVDFEGICANTSYVCEAVSDKLLQELLPFVMQSDAFWNWGSENKRGSTNPYLNWKDIASFEFDLPPLDQQRRIAETLWAVDEARQAWLEVGADTIRSRDVLLADLSNQSHPKVACGEILTLASGKAKPKGLRDYAALGVDVPVYGGNGIIGYTEAPLLSFQTLSIGRVGEYCGCVHFVEGASWITDNSIYVKEHSTKVELRFLYWVLRAANLNKKKKIAGQPLISQSTITEESIALPSISEQRRFLGQLDQFTNAAGSSAEHASRSGKLVSAFLDTLLAP